MDFKEIDKARRNLELGETASLKEIRDSYRRLSLKYHPDRRQSDATEENIEKFKIITEAYNLIMEYCSCYRYSFREKDAETFSDVELDKELFKNFFGDWVVKFNDEE